MNNYPYQISGDTIPGDSVITTVGEVNPPGVIKVINDIAKNAQTRGERLEKVHTKLQELVADGTLQYGYLELQDSELVAMMQCSDDMLAIKHVLPEK